MSVTVEVLPQVLGFVFFWIFFSLAKQAPGLLGSQGIDPIVDYLAIFRERRFPLPTIYWFNQSDLFLESTLWIGVLLSLLLTLGIFAAAILFFLLILYQSILVVGMDFTDFGWESGLVEFSLYTLFLLVSENQVFWWNLNFFLFRFIFISGVSKLQSLDPSWRNLTALHSHYLTQSMPAKPSWYAQKWPLWINRTLCLLVLFIEIGAPFLMLGGIPLRLLCFLLFATLQIGISLFGSFGPLNLMTLVMSSLLLMEIEPTHGLFLSLLGALFLLMQGLRFADDLYPLRLLEKPLTYCSLWNLFTSSRFYGVSHKERLEVIIEGSQDGTLWKEYLFTWKPCEPDRFPPRSAPYLPHLERNLWYLPRLENCGWFTRFRFALLTGSPPVLRLLRHNPFSEAPPKYIRSSLYQYTFTQDKRQGWWHRTYLAPFTFPESLEIQYFPQNQEKPSSSTETNLK